MANNYGKLMQDIDPKVAAWLVDMHNTLSKDRIDIKNVDNLLNILKHYLEDSKDDYINTILYPETVMYKKIPTLFPIPSATFQMHFYYTGITTNTSGNFAWTWNPYFLQDASATEFSTFHVNVDNSLTGSASSNFFSAVSLNYNQIPINVYGSFRVVSASVIISYVGRMDNVSGVLGAGVGLNNAGVGTPTVIAGLGVATFAQFVQVDNLYFKEKTQCANGLRMCYFPIDDKYTYFLPLNSNVAPGSTLANTYNTGFYFAGYGQGLQPQTAGMIRFDFYVNYECLVQPQFNNFIPSSPGNSSNISAIQTASDLIQSTPDLIVKSGSDIPGSNVNVGGANLLKKIARGKDEENLLLPNIGVLGKLYK